MMNDLELSYKLLSGAEIKPFVQDMATLRIEVFKEWPYLYKGHLDYEKSYLMRYQEAQSSLVILVFKDQKLIGMSSALALEEENTEFQSYFLNSGMDISKILYFGESILLSSYRGYGVGKKFMKLRLGYAQENGFKQACFCAVRRPRRHPLKPKNYKSLDPFWESMGFSKQSVSTKMSWVDCGEDEESVKELDVWLKEVED